MKRYILDASVIIAAFLKESVACRNLLRRIEAEVKQKKALLYAPESLAFEVANVLRFKLVLPTEADELYEDFRVLPIIFSDLCRDQMGNILTIAYENGTTVYDSAYHYLAKIVNGTFYTLDKNYFHKAKKLGSIELVH